MILKTPVRFKGGAMGRVVKNDVNARQRPGAVQTTFVVLICLTLMALAAYAGYRLLAGQSIGFDLHWLEGEIRDSLN